MTYLWVDRDLIHSGVRDLDSPENINKSIFATLVIDKLQTEELKIPVSPENTNHIS